MGDALKDGISLSDAIRAVQDELIKSQQLREVQGKPPLFETERLVLEANCIITKNKAADGGVDFKLLPGLEFGLKADCSKEESILHKITIEFKAIKPGQADGRRHLGEDSGIHPKRQRAMLLPSEDE